MACRTVRTGAALMKIHESFGSRCVGEISGDRLDSRTQTRRCALRHGVVVTAEVFRTDRRQLRAAILPIRAMPVLNTEAAMKRLLFASIAVLSCSVGASAS